MAVESLTVGLGNSNPYDNVSAVIRGKTVPQSGQSFMVDLGSVSVNFEIETIAETVRGPAESLYSITGRELRSEFLYRAVDFFMDMEYDSVKKAFRLPTASAIIGRLGLSVVYDAPDFRPTQAGMGWRTEYTQSGNNFTCKVRIREKNVQALFERLFSWTGEFGKRKICWHVRSGTVHIWEMQRATGQTFTITNQACPTDKLRIETARIRKFTEVTDNSSTTVTTPTASLSFGWDYADVPFSGSFSWGGATMSYSSGLLVLVQTAESNGVMQQETYEYGQAFGAMCMTRKTSLTAAKRTVTNYDYQADNEGSTLGTGRKVPVLAYEETRSWTIKDGIEKEDADRTIVRYHPLGNGFYGITATKYANGNIDQVQHAVSKGSPGGAASQYTERQIKGYHITSTGTPVSFPGYVLAPTRLPIEDEGLANEYLTEFKNLHGAKESKISAEIVGQLPIDPIKGKIVYKGVEYYVTESNATWTSDTKRISISGIRWEYDEAYRRNVLGYDS